MNYQIEFLPAALEQLRAMRKDVRRLIGAKLDRAQHDLSGDTKKLKGFKNNTACAPEITACSLS
jgi:hypothetical protein